MGPSCRWNRISALITGLALLMVTACTPTAPSRPAATALSRPTTTPLPAPRANPQITPAAKPTEQLAPTATSEEAGWDDRAIFRSGLIAAERDVLEAELPNASVYHLDLRLAPDMTEVTGQQQVLYTNAETVPLEAIYFRLFPNATGGEMRVQSVTVDGRPVESVLVDEATALRVPLSAPLLPGNATVISLDYVISVPTTLERGYGLLGFVDGVLTLDSPYAPIPVYDAEGWHVGAPGDNADLSFFDPSFYRVRVTAPVGLVLVASGVEVARERDEETQVVTFAAGPSRDFFLAASADFVMVSVQAGETRVNSYARREWAEGVRRAAETARRALLHFNTRFSAYPYTEMDVVSTPLLALGIEYPGITGISLRLYDPNEEITGLPALTLLESVVAHELAHQWFYSLVGNDPVDEPWLDEALAQYATALYFEDSYGANAAQQYRASWTNRWERVEQAEIPIGLPADAYEGPEYGAIVYGRGPFFLAALAGRMGQATFDRFLIDYVAAYRWGIANRAGFEAQAETTCQCSLDDLFATWVDRQ